MFVVALGVALVASSANAAYTHSVTLKMGMKSAQVMELQKALNVTPQTGYFGSITSAAVKAFQASNGLTADGIVGAMTGAKLAGGSSTGSFPAGCTSTMGYSSTTGMKCDSSSNGGTLTGGAGDLEDVQILSTYSNEEVMEGAKDEKVMAFEIEADNGSDLMIQNVKLVLKQTEGGAGSTRLNQYIDGVSVWMNTTKVGSADVEDFSESSDEYSRSISLSNAVVKSGDTVKFYVSVDALANIDSDDLAIDWTLGLESVRFVDGMGAVVTDSTTGELGTVDTLNNTTQDAEARFSFEDLASSGDIEFKVSEGSNSPDAQVVEVDGTSDTNNVTLLEFKVKASGTDMTVDNLEFDVAPVGANANLIVKEFKLLMNGEEIDSIDPTSVADGATGTIEFADLEEEIMIDEDETVTFKVVADINDLEGSDFVNGDSILVSFTNANVIDTTNTIVDDQDGDTVVTGDRTGSVIGERQTFFESGIMVSLVGTPTAVKTVGNAQASESDSGLFTITFDVTAFGSDVFIDHSAPLATGGSGESDLTISGTGTVTSNISSTTGATDGTEGFRVIEGTTERFQITTNILATATGFFDVKLGSLAYALTDVDSTTYYASDLDSFKTAPISLTDR